LCDIFFKKANALKLVNKNFMDVYAIAKTGASGLKI
jgi:hypothetical protein